MFTGIIEDIGVVLDLHRRGEGATLRLETHFEAASLKAGDSLAVNGACLTLSDAPALEDRGGGISGSVRTVVTVDVSHETLAKTTLGLLRSGGRVHLERALRLGDRLGGHLVSGHVDGQGELVARRPVGGALDLEIAAGPEVRPYLVPKGSVAVDGVSLTVNPASGPERFRVTLVPHTLVETLFGEMAPGTRLNLEADMLGKYVRHFLDARATSRGIDAAFLAEHGFGG